MSIVLMLIGWVLGIYVVTPETAGLFGVSVVFLIKVNDTLQKFLRQLIVLESMMVSVQRTFGLIDLPAEKEFKSDYDSENKIACENYDRQK